MKLIRIISGVLIAVSLGGCEKGHGFDCLKGTGDITTEMRTAGVVNTIILEDNINLYLTQDTAEKIVVEAGEKIIGSIATELENGKLTLRNNNRCNWVRSFNKEVNVYVSVRDLRYIDYTGSGDIIAVNEIISDNFEINIYDGSGSINLNLNTEESWITLHLGVADITVKGKSDISYVYTAGYGPVDCIHLQTDNTYITNNGSNNCFINVSNELVAKIGSVGNIYYKGNPKTIDKRISGSGSLISID